MRAGLSERTARAQTAYYVIMSAAQHRTRRHNFWAADTLSAAMSVLRPAEPPRSNWAAYPRYNSDMYILICICITWKCASIFTRAYEYAHIPVQLIIIARAAHRTRKITAYLLCCFVCACVLSVRERALVKCVYARRQTSRAIECIAGFYE